MESREGQAVRLGGLDMMRGVAILAVIVIHVALNFPSRFLGNAAVTAAVNLGVQLFFLVSAYTMGTMWRLRRVEPHRTLNFYIRRVCRIAPLYWAAILVYALAWGWPAPGSIVANVLLVHAVLPAAINSAVPGGWSIGVEIAFYLLFPLAARLPAASLPGVAFAWYILFGLGGEWVLAHAAVDPEFLFYCPLTQFPVFLIGMYAFEVVRGERPIAPARAAVVTALWIAVAIAARHFGLAGRPAFWVAIFAMAAMVAAVMRYGLAWRPLAFLGRISYSMYLLHFGVLFAIKALLPRGVSAVVALPLIVVATGAVAWLSFLTAERWSQTLARRLVLRRPGIGTPPESR